MARYTTVFDACVLYQAPLRDLLIELARSDLFRAKWTPDINEEWIGALQAKRPDIPAERLERLADLMNRAVPDCMIDGYQDLIPSLQLPDANDQHVLAAAIVGRADAIVTFNLKDFPAEILARYNIEAIHPDEFIACQIDLDQAKVVVAAQSCCSRLKKPPITAARYLEILEGLSLTKTGAFLRKFETMLRVEIEDEPEVSAEVIQLKDVIRRGTK